MAFKLGRAVIALMSITFNDLGGVGVDSRFGFILHFLCTRLGT